MLPLTLKLLNTEGLFPGFPAQSKWLTVPPHDGFEVYEKIVEEFFTQRPRFIGPMTQLSNGDGFDFTLLYSVKSLE